ncbi:MAG: DUF2244 domain-containing protein, partial [Mesorhizobium sp.]
LILMGALMFGWAITGAIFLAHGAWPVFGFLGLDVVAVYIAFRVNYRAARAREEISVSRTRLDIRKTAPSGRFEDHRFNPFWTRFSIARHAEIGITKMAVEAQGESVSIGSFPAACRRASSARPFYPGQIYLFAGRHRPSARSLLDLGRGRRKASFGW